MDRVMRWFEMPISLQISNIGSEVSRAIKYKNKNELDKAKRFCAKAIELIKLSEEDPKNTHRKGELDFAIEELEDYFYGENIYGTTDEMLHKYYDAFVLLC